MRAARFAAGRASRNWSPTVSLLRQTAAALLLLLLLPILLTGCSGTQGTSQPPASAAPQESPAEGLNTEPSTAAAQSEDPGAQQSPEGAAEPGAAATAAPEESQEMEESSAMKIQVSDGTHTVVFALNSTGAAKSLYQQLPLSVAVENYSNNEKIFYPAPLDTSDTVDADGRVGSLAYFSPWDNVVMYYGAAGPWSGLYELGEAVSGEDQICLLSGTIEVTAAD